MALFTDGTAVGIEDLVTQDSGLLEIAGVEGINLTTKLGLAQEEVALELEALLERARGNHAAALHRSGIGLSNVVVTSPIRLWLIYQTLVSVYRDGYFNQLNDRYKAKWHEFSSLAKWAKDKLIETGLGLVGDPVPQATAPTVTLAAAAENGGTAYVSVAFVNAAGEEGKASVPISVATNDGEVPDVQPSKVPASAVAWNIYCGLSPGTMYLQNTSPLDLETEFAFCPSVAALDGQLPGTGQQPGMHRPIPRLLQRG